MMKTYSVWHRNRCSRILASNPEVRALHGPYLLSQLWIVLLVLGEFTLAIEFSSRSIWLFAFASCFLGAIISHALGMLIHECTHNLVARSSRSNKLWMIVANLPLVAPAALEFRHQHLLHHQFLGEVDGRDTQAPTRAEIAIVRANSFRKFMSFAFGRFFYKSRPANKVPVEFYLKLNWGVQIFFMIIFIYFFGFKPVLFLLVSVLMGFGPHSLGARRISEHFPMVEGQPTVSYYGPWNTLCFNQGYHVEHHDFPMIAWARLPKLRALAKQEYDPLFAFYSWTTLLFLYFFDSSYRVEHYIGFGVPFEPKVKQNPRLNIYVRESDRSTHDHLEWN